MRLVPAVLALCLCATSAVAQEQAAAVDLVAKFVIGADDRATLSMDGISVGTLIKSGPGKFSATPAGGGSFAFTVTEKTKCVFDISFSQGGVAAGGIELDATKLQAVAYETLKENDNWTDYRITLNGQPNLLQELGPQGQLGPIQPTSQLSSSLTSDMMQAALAELQKTYCPAAP
jgi:hypothetical protein